MPSSRINEVERGAWNLPELKQRVQTLDNVEEHQNTEQEPLMAVAAGALIIVNQFV